MKQDTEQSASQEETQADQTGSKKKLIKRMRIIVTQKEIDESRLAKSDGCMIKQSLQRDHPEFRNIWVDKNQIRCTDPEANIIYTFQMAPRGRAMLLLWDAGETIKPFDIWVRNPIVRERVFRDGAMRPKQGESLMKKHLGPVPRPKTKEVRLRTGRDRVFGLKQWSDELAKLREDLRVT
jgi:hypothetical protein